jgi:hypothetical protein
MPVKTYMLTLVILMLGVVSLAQEDVSKKDSAWKSQEFTEQSLKYYASDDCLEFFLRDNESSYDLILMDMKGKVVSECKNQRGSYSQLPTSNLKSGIYSLFILTVEEEKWIKIYLP